MGKVPRLVLSQFRLLPRHITICAFQGKASSAIVSGFPWVFSFIQVKCLAHRRSTVPIYYLFVSSARLRRLVPTFNYPLRLSHVLHSTFYRYQGLHVAIHFRGTFLLRFLGIHFPIVLNRIVIWCSSFFSLLVVLLPFPRLRGHPRGVFLRMFFYRFLYFRYFFLYFSFSSCILID